MEILAITLLTDDLSATEQFYAHTFGLTIENKTPETVSFFAGQSLLTFRLSNNRQPKYHFAFTIPHNQFDAALAWASPRVSLLHNYEGEIVNDFVSWNAKAFYFYDNNGNILECIARYDLPHTTERPFNAQSIQSISEIGLVTDAPTELATSLIQDHRLQYFGKGMRTNDFIPLGTDEGLFIIVENGRKWFPTTQRAEKHFTRVQVRVNGFVSEWTFNEGEGA